MKKERQSNIELLRIVAMLLVLVVHAGYWRIGKPAPIDALASPLPTFTRIFIQQLGSPCVDVFIIISGFFAIRPKVKGVLNLWFLLSFWAIITRLLTGQGLGDLYILFPFLGWFIPAYLGLYLIAPVLNAYAENTPKESFARYLVVFFLLQTFFDLVYRGWNIDGRNLFNYGYSLMTMSGMYLLGRYLKQFPPKWTNRSSWFFFRCYLGLFLVSTIVQFAMLVVFNKAGVAANRSNVCLARFVVYTSPIVIAGSVCLFYAFAMLDFRSRVINHIAVSALGVFCFHSMSFYASIVQKIYRDFNGITVLLLDGLFILAVFAVGVVIDQFRILAWRFISRE